MESQKATVQSSSGTRTGNNVHKEGFTVLTEGLEAVADLVFVHGLQGHPKDTWMHTTSTGNLLGKLIGKSREDIEVYWPLDLLPQDFNNIRILTYGYDSHLAGTFTSTANRSGISDHGQDLLLDLAAIRRADPQRRLIFLAHSLGGLIVKETLRRARGGSTYLRDIYLSTYGIIFFGTPHRGASYAHLGRVAEAAAGVILTTNNILLEELRPNSPFLKLLREEFNSMLQERAFEHHSFQEGKALSNLKGVSKLIVDPDSSCLDDGERRSSINAHHKAMCRFSSSFDVGYVKVRAIISRYLEQIEKGRLEESQKVDQEQRLRLSECLRGLRTPAMHKRRDLIEVAEPYTFDWIFDEPKAGFNTWLKGNDQLFWIKGKAGSGKSTLLKYLCEHEKTLDVLKSHRNIPVVVAGFYFYSQGIQQTRRTLDGLLHHLLHQLLSAVPALFAIIRDIFESSQDSDGWKQAELTKAFTKLSQQEEVKACLCLFVDALDEYSGSTTEVARELLRLLSRFSHGSLRFKICASSRPLPEFETMLGDFPKLAIHDWTLEDIRKVVTQRFIEVDRGAMLQLTEMIVSEAKGVFLWVRLILKEILPYMFDGESEDELCLRFLRFPTDLIPFYSHLLQRVGPAQRSKIRPVLQMILCDGNRLIPLTLAEVSLAAELSRDDGLSFRQYGIEPLDDLKRCRDMERRLYSYLGGFLELQQSVGSESMPNRYYQPLTSDECQFTKARILFSHRTAKDFLLERSNFDFFEPQLAINNLLNGHLRLMKLYLVLAQSQEAIYYLLSFHSFETGDEKSSIGETDLISNFAYHAREVECLQHSSTHKIRPNLHDIRQLPGLTSRPKTQELPDGAIERPKTTIELDNSSDQVRMKIMKDFKELLSSHDPEWINEWVLLDSEGPLCFLIFAISHGLFQYAKETMDKYDPVWINSYNPPLLYWAATSNNRIDQYTAGGLWDDEMQRSDDFTHFLLRKGANPNAKFKVSYTQIDKDGNTISEGNARVSLIHFAAGGVYTPAGVLAPGITYLRLICILLEAGAHVTATNHKEYWYHSEGTAAEWSVLHRLVYPLDIEELFHSEDGTPIMFNPFSYPQIAKELRAAIKALLDHGADPNAIDSDGKDVFSCMMATCPYDVLEYALEKGALISSALLEEDGYPIRKQGILWEGRWRRPECYTPEAREIVRRHMPHWEGEGEGGEEMEGVEESEG